MSRGTYEVNGYVVVRRQVAFTIYGQEVEALALAFELGRELLSRDSCQVWDLARNLAHSSVVLFHKKVRNSIKDYFLCPSGYRSATRGYRLEINSSCVILIKRDQIDISRCLGD